MHHTLSSTANRMVKKLWSYSTVGDVDGVSSNKLPQLSSK
jgi:hypothetical protein